MYKCTKDSLKRDFFYRMFVYLWRTLKCGCVWSFHEIATPRCSVLHWFYNNHPCLCPSWLSEMTPKTSGWSVTVGQNVSNYNIMDQLLYELSKHYLYWTNWYFHIQSIFTLITNIMNMTVIDNSVTNWSYSHVSIKRKQIYIDTLMKLIKRIFKNTMANHFLVVCFFFFAYAYDILFLPMMIDNLESKISISNLTDQQHGEQTDHHLAESQFFFIRKQVVLLLYNVL